jgi:hypothetical protein
MNYLIQWLFFIIDLVSKVFILSAVTIKTTFYYMGNLFRHVIEVLFFIIFTEKDRLG